MFEVSMTSQGVNKTLTAETEKSALLIFNAMKAELIELDRHGSILVTNDQVIIKGYLR